MENVTVLTPAKDLRSEDELIEAIAEAQKRIASRSKARMQIKASAKEAAAAFREQLKDVEDAITEDVMAIDDMISKLKSKKADVILRSNA